MFKNQLQELAQRSCFNLPAYSSIREGPDHAPRFKASVNFNGEIFQCPSYCHTLRQAEHAAAEVALNVLSSRGSKSLTARVLDETGVYKNLLQETAHKAGLDLPVYTTVRSGPGHVPIFTCTVELAGMSFTGESAKTKKQAQKNAAIAAWSDLKKMPKKEAGGHEEQDQVFVTRVLSDFRPISGKQARGGDHHGNPRSRNPRARRENNSTKYKPLRPLEISSSPSESHKQDSFIDLLPPPPPRTTSKILPLTSRTNPNNNNRDQGLDHDPKKRPIKGVTTPQEQVQTQFRRSLLGPSSPLKVPSAPEKGPLSCAQMGIMGTYPKPKGIAPAVQIRSVIPVCSAPPPSPQPIKPLPLNPNPPLKEASFSSSAHLSSELSK